MDKKTDITLDAQEIAIDVSGLVAQSTDEIIELIGADS